MKTIPLPKELAEDGARKWHAFQSSAQEQRCFLPANEALAEEAGRVFAQSDFIARTCARYPETACDLLQSGDLAKSYLKETFPDRLQRMSGNIPDEDTLCRMLRQMRTREMMRIAWRDLTKRADLQETLHDLSALADFLIEAALTPLYQWHCEKLGIPTSKNGTPQQIVVLGMGKLGAQELNFSSDIDLVFAFPEPGETRGKGKILTNDEFFLSLGRRLIHVLNTQQADGLVFRVDMDLRPFGESGPLVMGFDRMADYYQHQGREWERYAWIKARAVAGDKAAGQRLICSLMPFIYRRYLDFGVFESLREMKRSIDREVRRKKMKDNIKLGPGGIREIEFFGQIFQLLRGGVVYNLRERSILKVLKVLEEEHLIKRDVRNQLHAAYVFLRNVENRLQFFSDTQTHTLPADALGRQRLAVSCGFKDWETFNAALTRHMGNVRRHFNDLLESKQKTPDEKDDALSGIWPELACPEKAAAILKEMGFAEPERVLDLLDDFKKEQTRGNISGDGRKNIDQLIPIAIREAGLSDNPFAALHRIVEILKAIRRRACYVSLLLENPAALTHLIKLTGMSQWIFTFLSRHPVLLDELLDEDTLYHPPFQSELAEELRRRLNAIPGDDLEAQMEELRVFKQVNTLRVAAADITNNIPLMRISDHLTYIAETVLTEVMRLTREQLVKKHGVPDCRVNGEKIDRGFAVIAYGKLGGIELGYASDLDLVFLHCSTGADTTGGPRPIDSTNFFSRMGQRALHILSAYTPAGTLYEVDMRLRPDGGSGLLVSHVDVFEEYQTRQAWTWEKQAIVRARAIAGHPRMTETFERIRKAVLAQPRDPAALSQEIREMRERLRQEAKTVPGMFDLKQGRGGMIDIEFLVQFLVLLHAHANPAVMRWSDNVRQIRSLLDAGVFDDMTAYLLRNAFLTYRAVAHRLSLREQPAQVPDDKFRKWRDFVCRMWTRFLVNA